MNTVLATAVAAGFVWSIFLFFGAVFIRERRQEAGFGWALAGAIVFAVTFCDRLPGHSTALRKVLEILPGVSEQNTLFTSSLVALWVLLVVYVFRIAVFYELFLRDGAEGSGDEDENLINDLVAPVLSYVCFSICLVALVQPLYGLGIIATAALTVVLLAGYFGRILSQLYEAIASLATIALVIWTRVRLAVGRILLLTVIRIAHLEQWRRGAANGRLSRWASDRVGRLDEETEAARGHTRAAIANAANRFRATTGSARGRRKK